MRLDNYNASFEAYEPFEPVAREDNPSSSHSGADTATPEQALTEERPSPLLSEMARNPPPVTLAPLPPAPAVELRRTPVMEERRERLLRERQERFEFDSEADGGLPRDPTPTQAEVPAADVAPPPAPIPETPAPTPVTEPAPQPVAEGVVVEPSPVQAPPAPAPTATPPASAANAVSIPLPLGPAVSPEWLNQREAALKALRTDFEASREAARNMLPADVATAGAGWVPAMAHGQGEMPGGAVWVLNAAVAATPDWSWRSREGGDAPADAGQWLIFNDSAYEASYRARLDTQAVAGAAAPLATLAELYGMPGQNVLAGHPELWTLATQDHDLNAGAPPRPGVAMGDALMLGQLDLYLADPFITQLRTQLGGTPAAPTGSLAQQQQQLYGPERYAQLTQLSQAMTAVRREHAAAMQEARNSGGVGWVDVPMQLGVDQETGQPIGIYATVGDGEIQRDANGMPVLATQRVFDEAKFTNDWLAQGEQNGGLAQQAFAQFYGGAHSQIVLQQDQGESSGPPTWVSQASLDNLHVSLASDGVCDTDLITLDLNHAPRLNDDRGVGFDLQLGWVTGRGNLHESRSVLDTALPIVITVMAAYAGGVVGGQLLGGTFGATIGTGIGAGAAGALAGGIINGDLSLKGVLRGALSGALTAGLTQALGPITQSLSNAGLGGAANVLTRMTVGGAVQSLLGGSFKQGALSGLGAGLAQAVGDAISKGISDGALQGADKFAAQAASRVISSALRALTTPGDPGQAFASELLSTLVNDGLGDAQKQQAAQQAQALQQALQPVVAAVEDGDGVQAFPVPAQPPSTATPLPGDGAATGPSVPVVPSPVGTTPGAGDVGAPASAPAATPQTFMIQPDGRPVLATGSGPDVPVNRTPLPDAAFPYPAMLAADTRATAFTDDMGHIFWQLDGPQVPNGSAVVVFGPPLAPASPAPAPADSPIDTLPAPSVQLAGGGVLALGLSDAQKLTQINAWLVAQGRAAVTALVDAAPAVADALATGARAVIAGVEAVEVAALAGLVVVAGAVNLVLIPPTRDEVTPLGDNQRFVVAPGALYGTLQERDEQGNWQDVKTGARLWLNGTQREALTDEEIAKRGKPLTTPIALPPAPLPGFTPTPQDPKDNILVNPAPAPAAPNIETFPIIEPKTIDDLIVTQNADNNRTRAGNRQAANPELADPSQLAGRSGPNGVGTWVYPDQPRGDKGADYEEQRTGTPSGIEVNVGGTVVVTPGGAVTAIGGTNFDGARVEPATGRTVLVDTKDWENYVLPDKNFWITDVLDAANSQRDALRSAGFDADIEWQASTEDAAKKIEQTLKGNGINDIRVVWVPKKGP